MRDQELIEWEVTAQWHSRRARLLMWAGTAAVIVVYGIWIGLYLAGARPDMGLLLIATVLILSLFEEAAQHRGRAAGWRGAREQAAWLGYLRDRR